MSTVPQALSLCRTLTVSPCVVLCHPVVPVLQHVIQLARAKGIKTVNVIRERYRATQQQQHLGLARAAHKPTCPPLPPRLGSCSPTTLPVCVGEAGCDHVMLQQLLLWASRRSGSVLRSGWLNTLSAPLPA